jgi:hypothetical protein
MQIIFIEFAIEVYLKIYLFNIFYWKNISINVHTFVNDNIHEQYQHSIISK